MVLQLRKIVKKITPEVGLKAFRAYKKYNLRKRLGVKLVKRSHIEFLGTEYSGYPILDDVIGYESICYCIGAGEEISFELLLSDKVKSKVFLFDPTPRSIKFVENVFEGRGKVEKTVGNEDQNYFKISSGSLNFLPFGIWERNEKVKMYAPQNNEHVSHSILNLQHTEEYFLAQCYTLENMMKKLSHNHIDLLKLNVEGAEYAILYSMLASNITPKILCVAFDEFHTKLDEKSDQRILDCLKRLEDADYQAVYIDNSRMTFVLAEHL